MTQTNEACGARPMSRQRAVSASAPRAVGIARHSSTLAATLTSEDDAHEQGRLSPHDRLTCPVHRRWIYECVSSPAHAIRVTGHRWCRHCDRPANIAIDELAGTVSMTCPHCHLSQDSAVNRQLLQWCRASIIAARHDDARSSSDAGRMRVA